MNTVLVVQPILALLAGLLILFVPRALNIAVAGYLILAGLVGLFPHALGA